MNDRLHISSEGISLIAGFEGCLLHPYQDVVGVWTIGYGHTRGVSATTPPLKDKGAALGLLRHDLVVYEDMVKHSVRVPLSQRQFDALVSFTYNVGSGWTGMNTGHLLNSGHLARFANHLLDWDKAGGRAIPGLTLRRKAERRLFLRGSARRFRVAAATGIR